MRRVITVLTAAAVVGACGGGGGGGSGAGTADVGGYLQGLPSWSEFSPPLENADPTPAGPTRTSSEQVQKAVDDGYVSQQYFCKTTPMSMTSTPEKIVMFSPDRELLWPGALIQGKSHRDGLGSLTGLPVRERAPLKVSIPSFATADNFRVVEAPDQATVNAAIGDMVASATASGLSAPSSIDFTMRDYKSDQSFALQAGLSGKYLGFSGSASGSVDTAANERTVMVHFVEKMFEVVVEPPQTPGSVFSEAFTPAKLDEQVRLGRIGPTNLPVYVSNVVYGRMMAFTFTSTASLTQIKAALTAAYKGAATVDFKLDSRYEKTLSEAKIAITSIGGPSTATVGMIASGNWHDYFAQQAALTSAYPISYTFRNLGDGSIAKVSEATSYNVKECEAAGGANFVLDSFEESGSQWQVKAASPGQPVPISVAWRDAATQQAIFYGYQAVTHTNRTVDDPDWIYDVGYLEAPDRFKGTKSAFYGGELSFWYKPAERMVVMTTGTTTYCYRKWILFVPVQVCETIPPLESDLPLTATDHVYVYDDQNTADQVILRGGGTADTGSLLTLTYDPPEDGRAMSQSWQQLVLSLSNIDSAGNLLCPDDPHGCWMVEDRAATEEEIRYVLSDVKEFRIRASYPVYRTYEGIADPVPLGFVGGYFDEIKLTRPTE
jgi:hypothetical protein